VKIEIIPRHILFQLLKIIFLLVFANLVGIIVKFGFGHDYANGLIPLFDLDGESNIPSFFSSLELLICSGLLSAIAYNRKNIGLNCIMWSGLALIFLFLSIDEIASLHELLVRPLRRALNTSGATFFAWVIPYGILGIGLALSYTKFLLELPKHSKRLFILSGVIYVTGVLGFEMIDGIQVSLHGEHNIGYALLYTCEELLEMVGMAMFIYTLMDYISRHFPQSSITIGSGRAINEIAEDVGVSKI
jgi:hypothetical protein